MRRRSPPVLALTLAMPFLALPTATPVMADSAAVTARPSEPDAYRMDDYRSATPATLAGVTVVDTAGAKRLFDEGRAVFVDVLPRAPRPAGLPASTVWHPKPRKDIPGSLWLVDTGYGALPPAMEAYFRGGLEKATAGDRERPLVFYCLRDCWMSWNAAKRALSAGYRQVVWYPDGTDGWAEAGLKLEPREPVTRPDE
jgi:PQQ-dependent catabolism-associated CXXCW motif protein